MINLLRLTAIVIKRIVVLGQYWYRLLAKERRVAVVGECLVLLSILLAVAGPVVMDFATDFIPFELSKDRLQSPTARHWMGTDQLGRDVFSRFVLGARSAVLVGFIGAGVAGVLGTTIGAIAGFLGGWIDNMLMRAVDSIMTIPAFFLMLAIASIFGTDLLLVAFVIGAISWTKIARIARGEFIKLTREEYVTAARAVGAKTSYIVTRTVLPNAVPPVLVAITLLTAEAILLEAYLAFLGLSDPSVVSWGQMLRYALPYMHCAWWTMVFPGAGIFLFVLGLNISGEGISDLMNPRLW